MNVVESLVIGDHRYWRADRLGSSCRGSCCGGLITVVSAMEVGRGALEVFWVDWEVRRRGGGEGWGDCGGGGKGSKLKVLIGSIAISLETER